MYWIKGLAKQIRALVRKQAVERELDEEIAFHVQRETEKNISLGLSPGDARRRAVLAFGGVEQHKETLRDGRGTRWLENFASDLRYAARKLRRSPGFASVAVITLALGIGATTAIFSVVNGVIFRPLPFEEPQQLVRLHTIIEGEGDPRENLSPPNFLSLQNGTRAFTDLAAFQTVEHTLSGVGTAQRLEGAWVSAGFFEVLAVRPILGRTSRANENEPGNHHVAVLSYGLWQQAFGGDSNVVGRTIMLDGGSFAIIGVMPRGFSFPDDRAFWVPIPYPTHWSAASTSARQSNTIVPVLARLAPGVTLEAGLADLQAMGRRLAERFPETNTGVSFTAERLRHNIVGEASPPLLLLLASVAFVLLIACANVVGLLLARAATRQEELAARAALGASRGRLVRQLLAESLLLGLVGGAMGLAVAYLGTEALLAARPEGLPRLDDVRVDATILAFASGLTLLAGAVVGLVPALQATRATLSETLRAGGRNRLRSRGGTRARGALVVSEIALAVVLLAGAGLLIRSFLSLTAVEPGFRVERMLAFPLDLDEAYGYDSGEKISLFYDRLIERLTGLAGVQAAAAASRLPIDQGPLSIRFRVEGEPPPQAGALERSIGFLSVSSGYLPTMEVPLLRGRVITAEDGAGTPAVIVINQAAAEQFFSGVDPIGKRLVWFSYGPVKRAADAFTIVGVVGDVQNEGLSDAPEPTAYFAHAQVSMDNMWVVVRTAGDPLALARAIRAEVQSLDPNLAIPRFTTLEQVLGDSVSRPRFVAALLGLFAAVALALAAIGIFGLMSFAVAQQTREIGIRIALGARSGEVLWRVVGRALRLAAIGLVLGVLGALALTRFIESVLFGVSATDPATYIGVATVLGSTVLLASLLPARRAAAVDPMMALRHE